MFIGDSLTCGEDDEQLPRRKTTAPRAPPISARFHTGMLLAKWLDAQVHVLAYGGRGIVRNWDGRRDVNTVPVFFERSMPDDPASKWDHTTLPTRCSSS